MREYIKREDVLTYIDRVSNSGLGKKKSLEYIRKYVEKTEPQKTCDTCRYDKEPWYRQVCDECTVGESNWKPKDEPQTETSTNAEKVQLKVQLTDEPQTERSE